MPNKTHRALPRYKISDFFRSLLKLRLKYKNCRFILVSRRCPNIEAIELRRPKRGARTRPRRYFADSLVMIRVFLLVHKNISDVTIASARNVNSFLRGVEINAIHAFYRRESCHFFAGLVALLRSISFSTIFLKAKCAISIRSNALFRQLS